MSCPLTPSEVCAEIKRIETNPQHEMPGPAINNLPAERGSRMASQMEHASGKGTGKE